MREVAHRWRAALAILSRPAGVVAPVDRADMSSTVAVDGVTTTRQIPGPNRAREILVHERTPLFAYGGLLSSCVAALPANKECQCNRVQSGDDKKVAFCRAQAPPGNAELGREFAADGSFAPEASPLFRSPPRSR